MLASLQLAVLSLRILGPEVGAAAACTQQMRLDRKGRSFLLS
jgi:hypothetical protein